MSRRRPAVTFRPLLPEEEPVFRVGRRVAGDVLAAWARGLAAAPEADDVPGRSLFDLLAAMYLNGVRDCAQIAAENGLLQPLDRKEVVG